MPMNDTPQLVPEDLVSVREAAQAAGVTSGTVHKWIARGRLTVQPGPGPHRVSRAAVQALIAPPDPHTPADAVAIYEALRHTDVSRSMIATWVKQGRLSTWRGRYGPLVRVEDVRALAQQRTTRLSAAGEATPLPADALFIRDVVRLSGVAKSRIYTWMRKGLLPVWPGTGTGQRIRLADVVALVERPDRALPPRPEREP